jgi:cytochrome b involved in lipid metabolism
MKITLLLGLAIALTLITAGCTQTPPVVQDEGITVQELSEHSKVSDCWIALDGKVYGVTDFIKTHPGGNALLEGCGKDATELFETRPMGSGTPHSEDARDLLPNYYIGDLK